MFAVILLGIGFIMVAAMFPVAIQQSRSSTEETSASVIARSAIAHLAQVATEDTMPATAKAVSDSGGELWKAIRGQAVEQTDPRYAWAAVYRRDSSTDLTAQVYVFVLQVRNHPAFNLNDLEPKGDNPASIQPKVVQVEQMRDANDQPINAYRIADPANAPMPAAAEGAYVILAAHDSGAVLRLGNPVNMQNGIWELAPGNDRIKTPIPKGQTVKAFMVGRGYHPDTPNSGITGWPQFEGPAMDIAVFTGFVQVK